MVNCSRGRDLSLAILSLGLAALGGCSSRNHNSDIPSSNQTVVKGFMTVENSPNGVDDAANLPLDMVENCTLENQQLSATFGSNRQSYLLELAVRDLTEDWQETECKQTSTNTTVVQNDQDQVKFFGCYVTAISNIRPGANAYDMHRRSPQMPDYTYNVGKDPKVLCTVRAKINLQSRVFEASTISCKQMAMTVANGMYANPIYNDRAIDLTVKDLRCSF